MEAMEVIGGIIVTIEVMEVGLLGAIIGVAIGEEDMDAPISA